MQRGQPGGRGSWRFSPYFQQVEIRAGGRNREKLRVVVDVVGDDDDDDDDSDKRCFQCLSDRVKWPAS